MYILTFDQNGTETDIAVFETTEEGRAFVSKLPGYKIEEENGFTYESFSAKDVAEYMEIAYNGHILPLSKFMFSDEGTVDIYWKELPDFSRKGAGMVDGATQIDAYIIPNAEVKAYIAQRERAYRLVKAHLEAKGCEADRSFHGSQDGEAIVYRKKGTQAWHFLTHLDPEFCEQEDVLHYVDEMLRD